MGKKEVGEEWGRQAENDHTAEKPGACPRASDRVRTHAPTLVPRRRVPPGLLARDPRPLSPLADAWHGVAWRGEITLTVKHARRINRARTRARL